MSTISTEAREQVVTAIATTLIGGPADCNVVTPAPEVPIPPMVAVTHGTPWQEPAVQGPGMTIRLRAMCVVRYSAENVFQLEELVEQVLIAIPPGWTVDTVTTPAQLDTGAQGVVLVSEVLLSATFATPAPSPAPPGPTVPAAPGEPVPSNWIETGGSWQFDLTWALSPDDGGSPIIRHALLIDGNIVLVDGNTGFLGAQFSDHYPIDVYVEAVNAVGNSMPSSATIAPPALFPAAPTEPWVTGWVDNGDGTWTFDVHWTPVEDPPVTITGYRVNINGTVTHVAPDESRLVDQVAATPITVRVKAVNQYGATESPTITATPPTP